jgi:hypothetical protein
VVDRAAGRVSPRCSLLKRGAGAVWLMDGHVAGLGLPRNVFEIRATQERQPSRRSMCVSPGWVAQFRSAAVVLNVSLHAGGLGANGRRASGRHVEGGLARRIAIDGDAG